MKINTFVLLLILHALLFTPAAFSESENGWPSTVEEAVTRIIEGLSEQDKVYISHIPKELLPKLHFTMGMGIRNSFGLWAGNSALIEDCGCQDMHIDDVSGLLIQAAWDRLRLEMAPDYLKQLDQTHANIRNIFIPPFSHEGEPLINIIADLNQEISKSNNVLLIEINDIRLGEKKVFYEEEKETPLHMVLLRLEFRSGLSMVNYPDRIVFSRP